jgi:hypothetical protein
MVWNIVRVVDDCLPFGCLARPIAQVRYFVHIEPTTREVYLIVQMLQHIFPVLGSIWMEIIHKICQTCPYFSELVLSLSRLDVHVSLLSFVIGIALSVSDAGFNYGHVLVLLGDGLHPVQGEVISIYSKGLVVMHVVDIAPNDV